MGENASKALLMAAGMIIAVLLISLLVVLYDQISTYYAQDHKMTVMEQTQKFNAKFENYNRNNIRGSDLISLMNKVIDYNASESYFDGTDYKRIRVRIILGNEIVLNQFKYDNETYKNEYLVSIITNTRETNDWQDDKNLIAITNTPTDLANYARTYRIYNLTDTKLQQLASRISNIIVDETDTQSTMSVYNRLKRAEIIEDVLNLKVNDSSSAYIRINEDTGIVKNAIGRQRINAIKQITSKYYQYMQFKRAYFDCVSMKYDEQTNRVVEMQFRLQVKDGSVVFD